MYWTNPWQTCSPYGPILSGIQGSDHLWDSNGQCWRPTSNWKCPQGGWCNLVVSFRSVQIHTEIFANPFWCSLSTLSFALQTRMLLCLKLGRQRPQNSKLICTLIQKFKFTFGPRSGPCFYMCLLRACLELTLVFVWSQSLKRPEVSTVFPLEHFEMKQFRWLTTLEGPWYTCENFPLGILWSSCSKVKSSEFKGLAVKKSGQPFPGSKSFSKETSLRVQIS